MPEALACCHLCDDLGLLVSNAIILNFPRHSLLNMNHSTPSLLWPTSSGVSSASAVVLPHRKVWTRSRSPRTSAHVFSHYGFLSSQIFWILLSFKDFWFVYTTCSRLCVDNFLLVVFIQVLKDFFDGRLYLQSERRLYVLRDQLKVQFRATQKAQVNERKAADSKRRLTSWVTIK